MFVVTVVFNIHPERLDEFMPLMLLQAKNSLTKEPRCKVFDVCQSNENPSEVFLYEVYDDRAAFDAHLASDHFKAFDRSVADMVAEKNVSFLSRL